jgi:K+-transporting ATPase A subunit
MGGKEILLKAIAQAIPAYAMSVFNIPKQVCKEICNAIARFWWGGTNTQRKMHWMAWWKMSIPKNEGGWAFVTFTVLIRQCWLSNAGGY